MNKSSMLLTFKSPWNGLKCSTEQCVLLAWGEQWEGDGVHCPDNSPGGVRNPGSQQSHTELHCSWE